MRALSSTSCIVLAQSSKQTVNFGADSVYLPVKLGRDSRDVNKGSEFSQVDEALGDMTMGVDLAKQWRHHLDEEFEISTHERAVVIQGTGERSGGFLRHLEIRVECPQFFGEKNKSTQSRIRQ